MRLQSTKNWTSNTFENKPDKKTQKVYFLTVTQPVFIPQQKLYLNLLPNLTH